jgi:hypothetical protein
MSFVGCVVEPTGPDHSNLFGSCFALGDPFHFVTADHVIEAAYSRGAEVLNVLGDGLDPTPAEAIFRHPAQDVAVLRVPHDGDVDPFDETIGEGAPGDAVRLFAYVGEGGEAVGRELVTEIIGRGHVGPQIGWRYSFDAFALEDAAGPAYSGSPVVSIESGRVVGILTQTASAGDAHWGVAMRLEPAASWVREIQLGCSA